MQDTVHDLGFDPARERALVRGVRDRDAAALGELARRLRCVPRILAMQNARSGRPLDEHDLADLVQDAVVVILAKLEGFAGRAPLESWMHRVCCLEFHNGVRRRRRAMPSVDPDAWCVPDGGSPAIEELERRETVDRALARLGGVEAEVIALKHLRGLTFVEMAARTGLSTNTLKTRYYRGLSRLEAILSGCVA